MPALCAEPFNFGLIMFYFSSRPNGLTPLSFWHAPGVIAMVFDAVSEQFFRDLCARLSFSAVMRHPSPPCQQTVVGRFSLSPLLSPSLFRFRMVRARRPGEEAHRREVPVGWQTDVVREHGLVVETGFAEEGV